MTLRNSSHSAQPVPIWLQAGLSGALPGLPSFLAHTSTAACMTAWVRSQACAFHTLTLLSVNIWQTCWLMTSVDHFTLPIRPAPHQAQTLHLDCWPSLQPCPEAWRGSLVRPLRESCCCRSRGLRRIQPPQETHLPRPSWSWFAWWAFLACEGYSCPASAGHGTAQPCYSMGCISRHSRLLVSRFCRHLHSSTAGAPRSLRNIWPMCCRCPRLSIHDHLSNNLSYLPCSQSAACLMADVYQRC